jgi:organic radical activating enzyme
MFGTNKISGKFNNTSQPGALFVTSFFFTIQGEGPFQGRPAVFIRLAKCNLACSWCDAFFDEGEWFTRNALLDEIQGLVSNLLPYRQVGVVVTGGEPSLQTDALKTFLEACIDTGFGWTQIESNGILAIEKPKDTQLVISPKCSEKNGKIGDYIRPHLKNLNAAACLKFVVSSDPQSPYHTVPSWALDFHQLGKPIYVSPMNIYLPEMLVKARERLLQHKDIGQRSTVDEIISAWDDNVLDRRACKENHAYAAQYALEHGFFLTLQMQLFASIA